MIIRLLPLFLVLWSEPRPNPNWVPVGYQRPDGQLDIYYRLMSLEGERMFAESLHIPESMMLPRIRGVRVYNRMEDK